MKTYNCFYLKIKLYNIYFNNFWVEVPVLKLQRYRTPIMY